MREIKFRAWDGERMRGIGKNEWFSIRSDGMLSFGQHGDPSIALMQFTGLKDKNGKEIYEGDICCYDSPDEPSSFEIVWRENGFRKEYGASAEWDKTIPLPMLGQWDIDHLKIIVIGNIHESPELLK